MCDTNTHYKFLVKIFSFNNDDHLGSFTPQRSYNTSGFCIIIFVEDSSGEIGTHRFVFFSR